MITTLHTLLKKAERGRYAIPAFNVTNLETIQAVLRAAAMLKSPVIIQTSEAAIAYAGHATILSMMQSVAADIAPRIPVVTHIDHGKHFPVVAESIRLGYTSVHMDASEKKWAANIALTRKAVVAGHRRGITVQGELGYLLGYEGMTKIRFDRAKLQQIMTDPDKAHEFVRRTGVDTLAIAVGTAHGSFKGKEIIDFQRLQKIKANVSVPLVLHGGSGVAPAQIRKAISMGIRIINLDTTLRLPFLNGLQKSFETYNPKAHVDIREHLSAARLTMEREASRLIELLGSAHKA